MKNHPEKLFLSDMAELERLTEGYDPMDLVRASGILRRLILDKKSLVHRVNVNKHSIVFEVSDNSGMQALMDELGDTAFMQLTLDGIDPYGPIKMKAVQLNLDQFLRHQISTFDNKKITIRDNIRFVANILGGVHYDGEPSKEYIDQQKLAEFVNIGGSPASVREIRAIGKIVLRALRPLISEVGT